MALFTVMERRDGRNCTGLRCLRRRGHAPEEPNALGRMVKKIEGSEYPKPRGANRIDPVGVFPYAWKMPWKGSKSMNGGMFVYVCTSIYIM